MVVVVVRALVPRLSAVGGCTDQTGAFVQQPVALVHMQVPLVEELLSELSG